MKKHLFVFCAFCLFSLAHAQEQTTPGITGIGFYDDFASSEPYSDTTGRGIYWWGMEGETGSFIPVFRENGALNISVSKPEANYDPLGVSFGEGQTINFSNEAKVKMVITNNSNESLKVMLALVDDMDNIAGHKPTVVEDIAQFWNHEIYFNIGPGEIKEVVRDLTGAKALDYSCLCTAMDVNMAKIKSLYITVLNTEVNPETYLPLALSNTSLTLHSVKVGAVLGGESDVLLDSVVVIDDTTVVENPGDTTVVVENPDSIPVLHQVGVSEFGFYYLPGVQDIFWWGMESADGSYSSFYEDSTAMMVFVHKEKANWDPIGLSFGEDELGNPITINLSHFAEMEIGLNNLLDNDFKLWFGLIDIHGNMAQYLASVTSSPQSPWFHESSYIVAPSLSTVLRMDLTNLKAFDYGRFVVDTIDLSAIRHFSIMVLNKSLDFENAYQPFALDSAVFAVSHVKVGRLNLEVFDSTNSVSEAMFANLNVVYGCTNTAAANYDALANTDNGSCVFTAAPSVVYGCPIDSALNYNEFVTVNDGTCIFEQPFVDDLPVLVKAGIEKRPQAVAEKTVKNCEIDFTKIIDKAEIVGIKSATATKAKVEIAVKQKQKTVVIESEVDKSDIQQGTVLKQKITCAPENARLATAPVVVELRLEIKDDFIITTTGETSTNFNNYIAYPNPVENSLHILYSGELTIVNALGESVFSSTVVSNEKIDVSQLNAGLYVLKLKSVESTYTTGLIKK